VAWPLPPCPAMTPVAVLSIWSDPSEFRCCRVLMYDDDCNLEICEYGELMFSARMGSLAEAVDFAELCRPPHIDGDVGVV
jgi:hypothetical protein